MSEQIEHGNWSHLQIVFYDGECGLCNKAVQFLLKVDIHSILRFAPLQEENSKSFLNSCGYLDQRLETFVYCNRGQVYVESTAALQVLKDTTWWGKLVFMFILVPPFIRNAIYRYVAKNRMKWFGKVQSCNLPTPNQRKKFLFG